MILFMQMVILFAIMLIGFAMAKKKLLDDHVSKFLSRLIVNVANPCLILSGCLDGAGMSRDEFFRLLGLSFGIFFAMIFLAELLSRTLWRRVEAKNIYKIMLVFSNMGFMGFPLISILYGSRALLPASVFLLPFNILIYTYGISCMSKEKAEVKAVVRKCFNAGVLAGILSIAISIAGIPVPTVAGSIIEMLSNLTAPLSMMVIGASFVEISFKELLRDRTMLLFGLLKLLVLPLAGFAVLHLFVEDTVLQGICMIVMAAPAGSMSAMLARQYDGDYLLASKGIAYTTLLSIATIPLVFKIVGL